MLTEDPVLLGGGQSREEREDLSVRQGHRRERLSRVPDLALAREEDEYVPGRAAVFGPQLLDGLADAGDLVDV